MVVEKDESKDEAESEPESDDNEINLRLLRATKAVRNSGRILRERPRPKRPRRISKSSRSFIAKDSEDSPVPTESESETDSDDKESFCDNCNKNFEGTWIQCDFCEDWFCSLCVPQLHFLVRKKLSFYCERKLCQKVKKNKTTAKFVK